MKRHYGRKGHYIGAVLFVAALVILLALGAGWAIARYRRSVQWTGNITFSADLAEEVCLMEHKAEKQPDGTYRLNTGEEAAANTYTVMPGVDIPKDPYVRIKGKSAVDAYLYIEVVDNGKPEGVYYNLTDNWILLDQNGENVKGENGGLVYVYSKNGTAVVLDETFADQSLSILKNDMVYVSQSVTELKDFSLCFYGYMAQATAEKTAAEIFAGSFLP